MMLVKMLSNMINKRAIHTNGGAAMQATQMEVGVVVNVAAIRGGGVISRAEPQN